MAAESPDQHQTGPEPGSGKSRALEVTEPPVPRPVHAVNTSPAYLFRKVSDPDGRPTVLYDEIDTVFGPKAKDNEDIRGMLNAGHRKGAVAGRCVVRGKIIETEELPAYCAVALAGLDDLPDTLMSRSVVSREPLYVQKLEMLLPDGRFWKYGDRDGHFVDITAESFSGGGLSIAGDSIQIVEDGSLIIRDHEWRPVPYMDHITGIATRMRNPNIEEYKRFGMRRVG